jgi:protein gp37
MAERSNIEWTDSTFNPWIGCTKVSPACDDCYAARSTPARTLGVVWGPHKERRRTAPSTWKLPERWEREHEAFFAEHGRRRRVFCASLADVFDNAVPPAWRAELFALIASTPHLDWLLLTKRIGNVAQMIEAPGMQKTWPAHARLGMTAANQEEWDRDIGKLLRLDVPNFVSLEPLLGAIDMRLGGASLPDHAAHRPLPRSVEWVIVGGESGPKARPMHPDWARSLRDQCAAASVPYLFKQHGEWAQVSSEPIHPESVRLPGNLCRIETPGQPDRYSAASYAGRTRYRIERVGKKAAGRLLDGVTHDGFPAVQR